MNCLKDVGDKFDLIHVHNEPNHMTVWALEAKEKFELGCKIIHDWHDIDIVRLSAAQKDEILLHAIGKFDSWSRDLWVTVKRNSDVSPDHIWFTKWRDQTIENLLGE